MTDSNAWLIRKDLDFLNHGSFGATPRCVFEEQHHWQRQLENDPIEFLAPERSLLPKLDRVRQVVGKEVNASPNDIAFVRNATEGVNAVIRSLPLSADDQILVTNHGYNACINAVQEAARSAGASVLNAQVPFPIRHPDEVLDAIRTQLTPNTKWMLLDHVTSPTGIVFPIAELVDIAHSNGTRVMVDGAHAPGMLPLNLSELNADYYTANHHKWWCGPKVSGFLHVAAEHQSEVLPSIISHGANLEGFGPTPFQSQFNWPGTFDPSPLIALPTAIDFLANLFPSRESNRLDGLIKRNHDLVVQARRLLLDRLALAEPAPESMLGSLATIPIPAWKNHSNAEILAIRQTLRAKHRLELPIFRFDEENVCLRISAQAYNSIEQYERLADAVAELT
ncbi:aminotransferase class V-fold PLP-dependent enzyme [Rhodopirellula halodulae]|uniref:aminotransferase class V-fold PLP-dependent enzyme n=1 Tax=Rhodopirellula halodulae TaxID=2894198 RepID=UPI001E65D068|nr:aminotransferase class V-fold PLP-dependent enzyme [Rhodopirellula sp. JC737]MCC9657464.1 aminotransferase class V-fold PLP-dependent enzyme [Rhodopirellula sp. JC737]